MDVLKLGTVDRLIVDFDLEKLHSTFVLVLESSALADAFHLGEAFRRQRTLELSVTNTLPRPADPRQTKTDATDPRPEVGRNHP